MSSNVHALELVRSSRPMRERPEQPMLKPHFERLFDGPATIRSVMV